MSLPRLLERTARPTLVLVDAGRPVVEAPDVTTVVLGDPTPGDLTPGDDHRWGCVVLVVADRAALRRVAALPPHVGRARAVVAWLDSATFPLVPDVRPEWPDVIEVDARLTDRGGAVSRLRFRSAAVVHEVLGQLGRDAGSPGSAGTGGLVLGHDASPEVEVPPDLLVGAAPAAGSHPVTCRRPVLLRVSEQAIVDEGVFGPVGFRREWDREVVDLPAGPVTEVTVGGLRDAQAVQLGQAATAYDVAALAMAGVPVLAGGSVPDGLDHDLAALVRADVDLEDPLRREEHSVRLRRAARAGHSTLARRTRLGELAAVRTADLPSVSVLLATRRPDLLPNALTQVAKQRRPVELVLVAHGFNPDRAVVRAHLGDRPFRVIEVPAATRFGDALDAAARAAAGDVVLKMDDDDWYGPDVVDDLLWARRSSGADLVGMPAEMVYLEPIGVTVRRRGPSECPGRVVAGGTMMLDRDYLRELGGFRSVTRFVDAQLLAAVRRSGGHIYRTQGLGYLLRRGGAGHQGGHTWSTDLGYFLGRRTVLAQWRGFRPSLLLTHGAAELPPPPGRRA